MADPEGVVVFSTPAYAEAALLRALLQSSGIPCEMLGANHSTMTLVGGGGALAIRLLVPSSRAPDARQIIAGYFSTRARADALPVPPAPVCLNCGTTLPDHAASCPGCRFALHPLPDEATPGVRVHSPDAKSCCRRCGSLSVRASGSCPDCGNALAPLKRQDRLCPELRHVVEPAADRRSLLCRGCKAVWRPALP